MAEKYIDLSQLKTVPHSRYGVKIDWKSSEGSVLDFKYDDIVGKLKILEYIDGNHVKIEVNGEVHIVPPARIKKCELGNVFKLYNHDYLYQVGDIVNTRNGKIKILKHGYKCINESKGWKKRSYDYECLDCGYTDIIAEHDLSKGNGCSCCANQKVVTGINDMWTTAPEIARLLLRKEEGYHITKSCNKRVDWQCPICGTPILNKSCNQIYRDKHVSCPKCSDGISYPNKFIYNLLTSIGVEVEREVYFDWLPNNPFDIVVEIQKLIIEMDGNLGHGKRAFRGTIDSIGKSIDDYKDNMAIQNGYDVLRIDCQYYGIVNRFNYIKESILQSDLVDIFNINEEDIDWEQIGKYSEGSYVYNACELYRQGVTSTKEIANRLDIHYATVVQYLKRGTKYGWCNYNPKESFKRAVSKECICVETGEHFQSYKDAAEKYKLPQHNTTSVITKISNNCRGKVEDIGSNNILGIKLHFISA